MIKDIEPLLKECEETLAEVIKMGNMEVACYVQGFINSINKLPAAEQRPRGEWTVRHDTMYHFECPFCKYLHQYKDNFCPLCGADMRQKEGEPD